MRERRSSEFIGIIILALGVVLALNAILGFGSAIFFKGWWTLFIIVPSVYSIFKNGLTKKNGIGVLAGVILFINSRTGFLGLFIGKLALPLILVAIGIHFLTKGKKSKCSDELKHHSF